MPALPAAGAADVEQPRRRLPRTLLHHHHVSSRSLPSGASRLRSSLSAPPILPSSATRPPPCRAMSESTPLLSRRPSWKSALRQEVAVDSPAARLALTTQCFIAGFGDAAVYAPVKTWIAFMTGNLTQLMISSVALLFLRVRPSTSASSEESSMHSSRVILSAGSVVGFALGAFLSQQAVLRFGAAQRARLAGTHLVGALIVLAVAGIMSRGYDLQSDVAPYLIGALACTMGAQAVVGQRSGNAPYATTVVFTATLTQVFADPLFPYLGAPGRRRVVTILALLLGSGSAQCVLELLKDSRAATYALPLVLCALATVQCAVAAIWALVPAAQAAEADA
ncbi:hypothetical protein FA09DRAFT_331308 [Tilletiopsis washingtonensis]|uniref:DUF1275-domain-containing protein n=1 Tax=Tilletiopsis washingtonensis TaxID=58919 RepID=A0A316Z4D6_9BASI|nr:hypothetical protein FA09DRAFT_331308 [Tilletiopsis washingtonensis]PWN96421.1 hypothetical protein FA09DRAFT_331308 [Tilletiopsis washingtonensis]